VFHKWGYYMSCIGQFTQRVDNFGVIKPSSQWIDSLMRWTVLRKQTTSIVFYLNRNRYCNIRYWNKQAAVASTNPQLPRCDLPNDYSINRWFMWCKITIIKLVLNYLWIQTNGKKIMTDKIAYRCSNCWPKCCLNQSKHTLHLQLRE
jgi:hypothetical protein